MEGVVPLAKPRISAHGVKRGDCILVHPVSSTGHSAGRPLLLIE